ncbi:MAG: glycosyltransferase family A protein [Methyloceanibacter sp.]|nr:glycosyltransferase family A protein [Methyloceanibacter sp.]
MVVFPLDRSGICAQIHRYSRDLCCQKKFKSPPFQASASPCAIHVKVESIQRLSKSDTHPSAAPQSIGSAGRLSVITRSCGRLPLLRRSFAALQRAAVPGMEWIIVDDNGECSAELDHLVAEVQQAWDGNASLLRSGERHRAKAVNVGLRVATGEFVHLFDDDDTISPDFYAKTIEFLEANPRFGAVATLSENVLERRLSDSTLQEVSRVRHYPELRSVSLAEFAVVQSFPPIAFVARRSAIDAAGTFDETLEVCEDYEFFLRFLTKFDIGVLPEVLCAFHRRQPTSKTPHDMRNSAASWDHRTEDRLFRNKLLRRDMKNGELGLGWLLALGEMSRGGWRTNLVFESLKRRGIARVVLNWLRRDI